jgi:di/tricarboxylate transporter
MSSTGVVAIFIPIVLRIARNARIPAGRLMMPLSVAALISGMMTLVATAPNLVVHSELMRQGHEGFGFFAFTPFGVPILVLAILYMLVARRFLAPGPAPDAARTRGADRLGRGLRPCRARAPAAAAPGSPLAGKRLDALDLRASAGINIIAIERGSRFRRKLIHPRAETVLEPGDILLIDLRARQAPASISTPSRAHDLIALPVSGQWFTDTAQEIGMAQIIVPPTSRLIGKTVTRPGSAAPMTCR